MKADLRTREGRRKEIRDVILNYGGFSVFWISDNYLRSCIADEMKEAGEIEITNLHFPLHKARIKAL